MYQFYVNAKGGEIFYFLRMVPSMNSVCYRYRCRRCYSNFYQYIFFAIANKYFCFKSYKYVVVYHVPTCLYIKSKEYTYLNEPN